MKKNLALCTALTVLGLGAGTALAGGSEGSLGIGAEYQLSGLGGVSANYDLGKFHVGGFFGFSDDDGPDNTDFDLGARFYYHLHSTAMSDFGIGGSLGIGVRDSAGGSATLMFLEPGIQLRAFVVSNVALSFSSGIVLGVVDAAGVGITGQFTALGGVHYYFF